MCNRPKRTESAVTKVTDFQERYSRGDEFRWRLNSPCLVICFANDEAIELREFLWDLDYLEAFWSRQSLRSRRPVHWRIVASKETISPELSRAMKGLGDEVSPVAYGST